MGRGQQRGSRGGARIAVGIIGAALATVAGCQTATTLPADAQGAGKTVFYAALGPELTQYEVDYESGTLVRQHSVTLPQSVHYAWPHPSKQYLYVGWSNGLNGDRHGVSAYRIDRDTGALIQHGEPIILRWRPVHITVDVPGTHVLVAYNNPSGASVHRIQADGRLGEEVPQPASLDGGIYGHQIRVDPSNRSVYLITRGNVATDTRPEEPGAIKVFRYENGILSNQASIDVNDGIGFKPRHIDFHPTRPWVYLARESENQIEMYTRSNDGILADRASFTRETLDEPGNVRPGQMTGAIHVHPNGRFVYISNRGSGTVQSEGGRIWAGGENSVAVFSIDQSTGEPTLVRNIDTQGFHPRTMAVDPQGRLLVVANMSSVPVRADGGSVANVPANLSVFRILDDGTLEFIRKYDVGGSMWVKFLTLP